MGSLPEARATLQHAIAHHAYTDLGGVETVRVRTSDLVTVLAQPAGVAAGWLVYDRGSVRPEFQAYDLTDADRRAGATSKPVYFAVPPTPNAAADALAGALEDVCNPLGYLKRMAEREGNRLSGLAYQIANDPTMLQQIARDALARYCKPQPGTSPASGKAD